MVALIGPFATRNYELRQAWKGATVVVDLCAEVWLVGVISNFLDALKPFLIFTFSSFAFPLLIVSDFRFIYRYYNCLRSSN
jgi:hypothetical protein